MATGKYTHNNNFFHPRKRQIIGVDNKTISQYFQEEGYFTQLISANSDQDVYNGHCLGYDRIIYKDLLKHTDIVSEFIDTHRVLNNRDIFTWLSFVDTHHLLNHIPSFSAGCNLNIEDHNYRDRDRIKSPFLNFDEGTKNRYIEEMKKVDFHLAHLYQFIENNYKEDEILISLVSDHGMAFTDYTKKTHLLRREKIGVPFMLRGSEYKNIQTNEIIENVDILPSILKFAEIKQKPENIDGVIPKSFGGDGKEFVFAESMFPTQTYKATIKDKEYEAFFETLSVTADDGKVNLKDFNIRVFNILNDKKIDDKEIITKYRNLFFEKFSN